MLVDVMCVYIYVCMDVVVDVHAMSRIIQMYMVSRSHQRTTVEHSAA